MTLYEGHNQQIRKMFDSVGHSVVKLRRIAIGNLDDRGLATTGTYRQLSAEEVAEIGTPPKPKRQKLDAKGLPAKQDPPTHSRALKPKKTFKRTFVAPKTDQDAERRPTARLGADKPGGPRTIDQKRGPNRTSAKPRFDDSDEERRPARGLKPERSPRPKNDSRPFGQFRTNEKVSDKGSPRGAKSDRTEHPERDRPAKSPNRTFSKPRVGEQGREKRPARGGKPAAKRSR